MNTPASPPSGQVYRLYYYVGGQRVAVRRRDASGDELTYIFGGHLGSTSITANANGTLRSRTLYHPWGTVRYQTGALPMDYTYTGQYSYTDAFGLMYYNARWYDPALGRFTQPDTIVPVDIQGTQSYDRFAYVNNNPVNYSDPTGHCFTGVVIDTIICEALLGMAIYSHFIHEPSEPADVNASDLGDLLLAGYEHADHATITGEGLQSLQDDPSVRGAQRRIVEKTLSRLN